MLCKACGSQVPPGAFFGHMRAEHPQEWAVMEEKRVKGISAGRRKHGRKHQAASGPEPVVEAPIPPEAGPPEPQAPVDPPPVFEKEPLEEVPEAKPSRNGKTKEPAGSTVKLQFVARTVQIDARVLFFYNLARQRFPEYGATEGEWLLDVVTRYYAEHAEEFGLDMSTMLQEVQTALLLEEEG